MGAGRAGTGDARGVPAVPPSRKRKRKRAGRKRRRLERDRKAFRLARRVSRRRRRTTRRRRRRRSRHGGSFSSAASGDASCPAARRDVPPHRARLARVPGGFSRDSSSSRGCPRRTPATRALAGFFSFEHTPLQMCRGVSERRTTRRRPPPRAGSEASTGARRFAKSSPRRWCPRSATRSARRSTTRTRGRRAAVASARVHREEQALFATYDVRKSGERVRHGGDRRAVTDAATGTPGSRSVRVRERVRGASRASPRATARSIRRHDYYDAIDSPRGTRHESVFCFTRASRASPSGVRREAARPSRCPTCRRRRGPRAKFRRRVKTRRFIGVCFSFRRLGAFLSARRFRRATLPSRSAAPPPPAGSSPRIRLHLLPPSPPPRQRARPPRNAPKPPRRKRLRLSPRRRRRRRVEERVVGDRRDTVVPRDCGALAPAPADAENVGPRLVLVRLAVAAHRASAPRAAGSGAPRAPARLRVEIQMARPRWARAPGRGRGRGSQPRRRRSGEARRCRRTPAAGLPPLATRWRARARWRGGCIARAASRARGRAAGTALFRLLAKHRLQHSRLVVHREPLSPRARAVVSARDDRDMFPARVASTDTV